MTPSDDLLQSLQETLREERYRLIEPIGRGGMGTVYRAEDTVLGREVAVKVIETGLPDEAAVTARLEHPGIVPVHDAGVLADGRAFYAMKLVRGQRLDEWITAHEGLVAERLNVFVRICEPVSFAHAHGVVHRDLKPANVMIGAFGEVLVLDWGVAAEEGDERRAGTAGFMPPEGVASPRGDVYALGVLLRAMLPPDAPKPLRSICGKASTGNPAERYATPLELAADVNRYLAGEKVEAHGESVLEKAGRLAAKHKTLLALIAAYVVMRAALVFWPARP